jgi:hypothetical protein
MAMLRTMVLAVLVLIAPLLLSAAAQEPRPQQAAGATGANAAATPQAPPWIEFARVTSWPVTALVLAFAFRRRLAEFVAALGARVTKLSVFKVEIELIPATSATSTSLLAEIKADPTSASISDSSRMMLDQVQMGTPADYANIDLGTGDEWLTSRLFIAVATLERMRNLQVLVFVEKTPTTDQRFIAVASVQAVRWGLAQRYPYLEAAWARAYLEMFPQSPPPGAPVPLPGTVWPPDPKTLTMQSVVTSDTGAMEPWQARQLVARFINSVQRSIVPDQAPSSDDWVRLRGTVEERADWVTRDLLRATLPREAFSAWTDAFRDAPRSKRTRAVLRQVAPFVALTQGDREFVRLVNRKALLEGIVAPLADEPEGD